MAYYDCRENRIKVGDLVITKTDARRFIEGIHKIVGFSKDGSDDVLIKLDGNSTGSGHDGHHHVILDTGVRASSLGLTGLRYLYPQDVIKLDTLVED